MKQQAIVTIVSNNYLHYARTLMQSVAREHPDAQRYCVIVDTDMGPSAELAAEFDAIALSQLDLPFGEEFLFQYTVLELNTAVKPWALDYLLARGHSEVLYIDPDIYLYQPLSGVTDLLRDGASVVLTPHLLAPLTDDRAPGELTIRMVGTYNLGFCAVGAGDAARAFLKWWQGKLARDCVNDMGNGIFVDQSWIDLVPGLFDNVAVLRHPGYNAAYWNLAQREVGKVDGAWQINGQPLAFFHFSGIDPSNPQNLSKHQNRYTLATVSAATRDLFLQYCARVVDNGIARYRAMPYGFEKFSDGTPITPTMRARYRATPSLRRAAGPHPFTRPDLASAIASVTDVLADGTRLDDIYMYFLGRRPDPSALQNHRQRCDSLSGSLRVALGVSLSPESRAKRGWKMRLLLWPLQLWQNSVRVPMPGAQAAKSAAPPSAPSSARRSSESPGINLVGYIAAELGVGEGARGLARACHAAGVAYSVVDVGYQTPNLQRDTQALTNASSERFAIDLLYVNADQTPRTVEHLKKEGLDGRYKIGYWHWEQPKFPEAFFGAFAHVDEIWAPSTFVHDAIAAVSPRPVVTIPHAIHVSPSADLRRSRFGLPDDKLLALVMYDFHSYQQRKNPQAAIAAFRKAAGTRGDAALVVKTINSDQHPEAVAELRAHLADLPNVVFIDRYLTRQEAWDLQACCDILISLHRAEGFGLVPAEMMFLGKPVVATGWSANMDFMTGDNSMPVQFTLTPLAETLGAYPAGPLWADADVDHAAACIRRLLDDRQLREQLGTQAARDIGRQLSPAAVGKQVAERLRILRYWNPAL